MKTKNAVILVLTAFIWGTAFVAQSVGMDYLGPFTFNGVRSIIGGAALLPCIAVLKMLNGKGEKEVRGGSVRDERKNLILGGIACGLLLFGASSLQQIGIQYTTAGKAGFITACYIVIVPVLGIFLKKKTGWKVWAAVIIALAGLYFLCMTEKFSVGKGDVLIFFCALVFSVHILVIDYFSPKVDGRDRVDAVYVSAGNAEDRGYDKGMDASFVRGSIVLRRGLYSADHRSEECKSCRCIFDFESGVLFFRTGRMGCVRRTTFCAGIYRMRVNVCGDYFGAIA